MSAGTDRLQLADADALSDLGRYAVRAKAVDDAGAMRLQAFGGVLAAWVGVLPGRGILGEGTVLGLRTFALAAPATLDVVVPLGAVTDRTARPGAGAEFPVPPTLSLAPWAALTPPRSGWEHVLDLPCAPLAEVATAGIGEVAAALAERGAAAGFTRERVWDAPLEGGLRAGGAFAAYALGFLTPDGTARLWRTGRWLRLSAPGGHVLLR